MLRFGFNKVEIEKNPEDIFLKEVQRAPVKPLSELGFWRIKRLAGFQIIIQNLNNSTINNASHTEGGAGTDECAEIDGGDSRIQIGKQTCHEQRSCRP